MRYILPLTAVGAFLGAWVTPWLTTRPAIVIGRAIREMRAAQLLAGIIGLILGLLVAALAALPLSYLPYPFRSILPTVVAILFGYLGIMVMVLRQRDIFALFSRRREGELLAVDEGVSVAAIPGHQEVLLLDTSAIIDGRIADVAQTGFIRSPMLVPRFVLAELQYIADSPDVLR
ncbi:MAG: PIN domain nuclease, partial [Anaerolineae bacterium]